ncbi:MAG: 4-(cytidine 5'-diphospho)-2-C-methyl-D-erythritol kinase [Candidatus Omnitrophica bacterium]|nr:4-(cytidine 5'-diphospho)-2-C-methyl-D-erythritol kinase [Candidatus Omnitrophota bacterium]
MRSLTLSSPAKVNLYLRVVGRESNGYHRLVTLFHRISLQDKLRLAKQSSGFSLTCSNPSLSLGEDNLITRAYRLFKKSFPRLGGVRVHLTKRIPMGGGLGGGSSNAAFFLLGMKKLYGLKITRNRLMEMGKTLGADVPFFLENVNQALGRGRGDKLHSRPSKRQIWFVLLIDNKGLSTKLVYQNLPRRLPAVSLTKLSRAVTILCDFLDRGNILQAGKLLENDLELPACRLRPSIQKKIIRFRSLGIKTVRMSGSGPTVFAILSSKRKAESLVRKLRNHKPSGKLIVCHTF